MPIIEMYDMIFEWHDDKAELVFKNRGISLEEASSVLLDIQAIQDEDIREYDEVRYITIGMSNKARILVVVWTERFEPNGGIRVITAYQANKHQQKRYQHG